MPPYRPAPNPDPTPEAAMRLVYFGSGEFGCPTLTRLAQSRHDLLQVVTQPARPAGRGKKLLPTPIADQAARLGLNVVESADVNTPDFVAGIGPLEPDLLVIIAFGQKIGSELINLPGCRAINLHGSLLPAYRGAAPINWAIINGETRTGVTIIEINEVWDAGAMLGTAALEIDPLETAGELHDRLALLGPDLMLDVIDRLEAGTLTPVAQDHRRACRAPKLTKQDAAIDWNQPADALQRRIRGMWPWPGAYTHVQHRDQADRQRIALARARVVSDAGPGDLAPGQLDHDLHVVCMPGRLELLEVRPDNGKLMDFAAYCRGRRLQPGDGLLNG